MKVAERWDHAAHGSPSSSEWHALASDPSAQVQADRNLLLERLGVRRRGRVAARRISPQASVSPDNLLR